MIKKCYREPNRKYSQMSDPGKFLRSYKLTDVSYMRTSIKPHKMSVEYSHEKTSIVRSILRPYF